MNSTRAGYYKSNLQGDLSYKSFVPAALPPEPDIEVDSEMLGILIKAHSLITLLEGLVKRIPSINLFISMYVRKEALLSSQIEGTQATLEDVLDPLLETNTNQDVSDVINYIKATNYAIGELKQLPLCNRLLRATHAVLLQGIRGDDKEPGEFRRSQNWIGANGCSLSQARYVPPNVEDMQEAIGALEKYINMEDVTDHLLRIGLIHYQFETIHPFLDGNGRIGRLLIILYLLEKQVISAPVLYVSYYLKLNRIEYYDRMSEVRRTGNYEQWLKFFLQAFIAATDDAIKTIDDLSFLHDFNSKRIEASLSARSLSLGKKLLIYLEENPIIDIGKTAQELNVAYNTVARMVDKFQSLNILQQVDKKGRTRIYSYEPYLNILRKNTEY